MNVPVRYCSMCGEVVNESIPEKVCSEDTHAISRRKGTKYCVDCGMQLIKSRCHSTGNRVCVGCYSM